MVGVVVCSNEKEGGCENMVGWRWSAAKALQSCVTKPPINFLPSKSISHLNWHSMEKRQLQLHSIYFFKSSSLGALQGMMMVMGRVFNSVCFSKTNDNDVSVIWSLSGLGDPECSDSCSERLKVTTIFALFLPISHIHNIDATKSVSISNIKH